MASEVIFKFESDGPKSFLLCNKWLVDAVKTARSLCQSRIQAGETNIKLHAKLGAVLAQVEYSGSQSLQDHILRSIKEGLEASRITIENQFFSHPPDAHPADTFGDDMIVPIFDHVLDDFTLDLDGLMDSRA